MIKNPDFPPHEFRCRKVYLLENLPAPLTRADEHWQIFDDYTAWPEFRLRQIRVPQTREWFRVKEEIIVSETGHGLREEISRTFLPGDETGGTGPHPEKEIRKNRYFYEFADREFALDVFMGALWGLILAQVNFADKDEAALFSTPEFAATEVSGNEFFRGENLVEKDFEAVRKEFARLKVMGNE